jgi:hypothetical protein
MRHWHHQLSFHFESIFVFNPSRARRKKHFFPHRLEFLITNPFGRCDGNSEWMEAESQMEKKLFALNDFDAQCAVFTSVAAILRLALELSFR